MDSGYREYRAFLRCQTWNVWPERTIVDRPLNIVVRPSEVLRASLAVISYLPRSAPEQYLREETKVGPLVWDGEVRGLHHLRESILKAPEDETAVELQYRNTWRGEVDIGIGFRYEGDLPGPVIEAVRATAYATMSLLNLQLDDHMVPAAPFSIRELLPGGGGGGMDTGISVAVRNRQELDQDILEQALRCVTGVLMGSPYGEKFRVALELYAAHVTEVQVRVRFLLLVMAMESLAEPTTKPESVDGPVI